MVRHVSGSSFCVCFFVLSLLLAVLSQGRAGEPSRGNNGQRIRLGTFLPKRRSFARTEVRSHATDEERTSATFLCSVVLAHASEHTLRPSVSFKLAKYLSATRTPPARRKHAGKSEIKARSPPGISRRQAAANANTRMQRVLWQAHIYGRSLLHILLSKHGYTRT